MAAIPPLTDDPSQASPSGSHAAWLKKQFSSLESPEEPWPDLLIDRRSLQEKKVWKWRDPVEIERNNLIKISQLVIKAVVDSSLRYGRQLDNENIPLHHLFVVLDLVLRHGFKAGRRIVYGKREVWDLLQLIERYEPAAAEITLSARELPTVRTPAGRARAWLRLALMQKKLPDYFKLLVEKKDELLADFYDPSALVFSEEGVLMAGLLVSLNIVDFNLCVKEDDLDNQEGVIDLSMYLRRKEDIGRTGSQDDDGGGLLLVGVGDGEAVAGEGTGTDLTAVIDQKNYIEEVNRSLAANIANLQARVESLTTTNALMREDVAISHKKIKILEEENKQIGSELEKYIIEEKRPCAAPCGGVTSPLSHLDPSLESQLQEKLKGEQERCREMQKEMDLEDQMKAEMEMAMKLLEKDVHEKQDTIISLRSQLEDIKSINLEMYTKLSECQKSMEYKSDIIQKLEAKSVAMAETLLKLDTKYVESEKSNGANSKKLQDLTAALEESEESLVGLAADVKIEREWRERLQETSIADKGTITELRQENEFLKQVSNDYESLRMENSRLREGNRESEQTLEELGQQLSWAKLQLDNLKEEVKIPGAWERDADASNCKLCSKEFSLARRKHHCRNCGGIFCDSCSDNKMKLPSGAKPLRVCDNCFTLLLDRQSKILS